MNLAREVIRYCQQDCISLYQILIKFSNNIFNDLKVSTKYTPTTSSLALRAFRTKFLSVPATKDTNIPVITGEAFDFIKQSYTGGPVDVYYPHGFDVHHYDVNSLYPSIMEKYPLPVGDLTYFEGDISQLYSDALAMNSSAKNVDKPFGFFEVEIETPDDLKIPVLQTRVVSSKATKTLAPLGKWRGIYSSAEIYNAMDNFGYKFKVLRGYLFKEVAMVYDKYVNYFSNIKTNTPKSDPMYLISKLLMNSLYGKTGQSYKYEDTLIVNHNELLKLIQDTKIEVSSITELDKDLTLVTCLNKNKYEARPDNVIRSFNGSIAHASLITALARVEMFNTIRLLTELGIKVFYMDTDSLFTDKPLPEELVHATLLGKFKLEHIYKEAVFLAPKVYGGVTLDGKEIIKVKGLKYNQDLNFDSLKSLLNKDSSLIFNQDKLISELGVGVVTLLHQTYTLIPTDNRRELVYNNNILVGTKPYVVK